MSPFNYKLTDFRLKTACLFFFGSVITYVFASVYVNVCVCVWVSVHARALRERTKIMSCILNQSVLWTIQVIQLLKNNTWGSTRKER